MRGQEVIGKSFRAKLIKNGNKIRGERIFFKVLRDLKKKENVVINNKEYEGMHLRPLEILNQCVENISPKVAVISKKVGGSRYQIPVPVKENKEYGVGVSWLIQAVKSIKKGTVSENLLKELNLAKRKEGEVLKKRNALHKVAISNIAFLKFIG